MDDLFGDDAWGEEVRRTLPLMENGVWKTSLRYSRALFLFFYYLYPQPDWAKEGDDDDGDAGEESEFGFGAQHVLVLIDCHSFMFQGGDENETPFDLSMQFAQMILKRFIREVVTLKIGKRNGVGVLLYQTKQKRGSA